MNRRHYLGALITAQYLLLLAADRMLTIIRCAMEADRMVFKREKKLQMTRMINHAKGLSNLYDEIYRDTTELTSDYRSHDSMRADANHLARIVLKAIDRSQDNGLLNADKLADIENFIEDMASNQYIPDTNINRDFTMR